MLKIFADLEAGKGNHYSKINTVFQYKLQLSGTRTDVEVD